MKISAHHKLWLFILLLLFVVPLVASRINAIHSPTDGAAKHSLATLPPIMLWAWERPEKLEFIDPEKVGVAFLTASIYLRGDEVVLRPRLQPLQLRDGTKLVAVVRIETDRAELSARQRQQSVSQLIKVVERQRVDGLQIDFDATSSERNFYKDLLSELRPQLPPNISLSITALASWCAGDNWLENLPIDEAVPMLFRMGVEQKQFETRLQSGYRFPAGPCKASAGVSIDQPIKRPQVQRLYIFNPKPWSANSLNQALEVY